jgi:hypothetical protein
VTERIWVANDDPCSDFSVVFEDDGRVAWAYLLKSKKIVTDVWLYNHGAAPAAIEPDRPPRNPAPFASAELARAVERGEEVSFRWLHEDPSLEIGVEVLVRGLLFARLTPGVKPGWARMALQDGPCAKVLPRGKRSTASDGARR